MDPLIPRFNAIFANVLVRGLKLHLIQMRASSLHRFSSDYYAQGQVTYVT
jgi:hypothetical protein